MSHGAPVVAAVLRSVALVIVGGAGFGGGVLEQPITAANEASADRLGGTAPSTNAVTNRWKPFGLSPGGSHRNRSGRGAVVLRRRLVGRHPGCLRLRGRAASVSAPAMSYEVSISTTSLSSTSWTARGCLERAPCGCSAFRRLRQRVPTARGSNGLAGPRSSSRRVANRSARYRSGGSHQRRGTRHRDRRRGALRSGPYADAEPT